MFGVISDWIGLIGGIVGIASGAASVFSAKSAATSNRIAKDALEENKKITRVTLEDAIHSSRENNFVAFMVLWGATGQQRQDTTNRDDRHLPAHHCTSNGARPRSTSALTCKSSASSFISFTLKAIRPVHFCETVDREQCNVSATSACVRPLSPIRRLTFSPTVGESTKMFVTLTSNHEYS